MGHRMILASADLKTIYKVVVVPKGESAGVAQVGERPLRKREGETSSVSTSPKIEE